MEKKKERVKDKSRGGTESRNREDKSQRKAGEREKEKKMRPTTPREK